ncbi:hypothetical protein [Bradyrhizobium sp. USDA 4486]
MLQKLCVWRGGLFTLSLSSPGFDQAIQYAETFVAQSIGRGVPDASAKPGQDSGVRGRRCRSPP